MRPVQSFVHGRVDCIYERLEIKRRRATGNQHALVLVGELSGVAGGAGEPGPGFCIVALISALPGIPAQSRHIELNVLLLINGQPDGQQICLAIKQETKFLQRRPIGQHPMIICPGQSQKP